MGCFDEIKSRNFSLYGQWLGIASIILLIALGIVGLQSHIVFSIVGWVIAFILLMVEIPLCLKVCPTSPKFDGFIAYFENCYFRAVMYLIFAVVMFLSRLMNTGPLIAAAVCLLLAAISYGAAAVMGQSFASSRILGGTGVDNVV
ncbi:golgi apparatus membrane protein TVP18 [Radiomyces spectabilis]|uniref:golgi apparatus membrane protein TVP18 n=1 Tax=Radiomyces spectabilis TaxID=64574 RepID=UPI00221EBC8C|nr:golgi apparatus membrane protein TVP18 [Radiomyces spectabilis]KAI8370643.1 golgi apparatus membrane protein TVP18 [Radiomyces spectabilis]